MIRFDDSAWPLIVVHFEGRVTDEQFLDYLERLTFVLSQRTRYAVVYDASRAQFTPFSQRRLQANWLRTHRAEVAELNAGTAFVFTSSVFRWVLSGIFMLQPPPMPHTVCGELSDGVHWAAKQLGIEAPAGLLAWDPDETTQS